MKDLKLSNTTTLAVDNTSGPVTLYVTNDFAISGQGRIAVSDPNPEKFAIYMTSPKNPNFSGSSNASFYGVLYAPYSSVAISGSAQFFGAFVGQTLQAGGQARVHYDSQLRGQ